MQGLFREIAGIAIIRKTGVDLSESSNARDPEIKGIRSRTTIRRDFLTKAPPPKPLRYGHICSTQNRMWELPRSLRPPLC